MPSVTRRINQITQPRGGYINPRNLLVTQLGDGEDQKLELSGENIHASLVGMAVDYLTRTMTGLPASEAFHVSMRGAAQLGSEYFELAAHWTDVVQDDPLSDEGIVSACQLVGFDIAFRQGPGWYDPESKTLPDELTISHVREMVKRSLQFFDKHGPVTLQGFTFGDAYTELINTGDGDFLTADTLWDFKVSVSSPKKEHTLQLLVYWIMGVRSGHPEFAKVSNLGVFNPRLNCIYSIHIGSIEPSIIAAVETDVIGYN